MFNNTPCHEDENKSWGIAPCNLNLGTTWRWVVSVTLWPLGTEHPILPPLPPVPTRQEAGWVSEPVRTLWGRENLLPLLGVRHGFFVIQAAAQSPYPMSYPAYKKLICNFSFSQFSTLPPTTLKYYHIELCNLEATILFWNNINKGNIHNFLHQLILLFFLIGASPLKFPDCNVNES
jgi:hypothetical protein